MSIRKISLIIGLTLLLSACANGKFTSYDGDVRGNNISNTDWGVRYLLGRGVSQDNEKAFEYFSRAANKEDNAFAQNELAFLYASGKGTEKNNSKAFFYYQKAAKQGLASAQFNLGLLYQEGLGTKANPDLAKKWITKSAAHGFEPARAYLARTHS